RFELFDFQAVPGRGASCWRPARYLAFVLPAGEPDSVRMIDLGEAGPIDRLVADFRAALTGEADSGSRGRPSDTPAGGAPGRRGLWARLFGSGHQPAPTAPRPGDRSVAPAGVPPEGVRLRQAV